MTERVQFEIAAGKVVDTVRCEDAIGRVIETPVWSLTASTGTNYRWATAQRFYLGSIVKATIKWKKDGMVGITRGTIVRL